MRHGVRCGTCELSLEILAELSTKLLQLRRRLLLLLLRLQVRLLLLPLPLLVLLLLLFLLLLVLVTQERPCCCRQSPLQKPSCQEREDGDRQLRANRI